MAGEISYKLSLRSKRNWSQGIALWQLNDYSKTHGRRSFTPFLACFSTEAISGWRTSYWNWKILYAQTVLHDGIKFKLLE